jgi:hypothetical protein
MIKTTKPGRKILLVGACEVCGAEYECEPSDCPLGIAAVEVLAKSIGPKISCENCWTAVTLAERRSADQDGNAVARERTPAEQEFLVAQMAPGTIGEFKQHPPAE